jgi:hypothetical protein
MLYSYKLRRAQPLEAVDFIELSKLFAAAKPRQAENVLKKNDQNLSSKGRFMLSFKS